MKASISNKAKKSVVQCFKRVAITKCFYFPSLKDFPEPNAPKDYLNKLEAKFIKKYPELKKEKIIMRASGPNYHFDVGDTIPNNMPVKNICLEVYYKLCKITK